MSRLRLTQVADPSNPPATTLELYYDSAGPGIATPVSLSAIDQNGVVARLAGFAILDYRLIAVRTITASPYVPTTGTRAIYVECIGGGGAGGGVATAVTNSGAGGGGGGGAYSSSWLTGAAVKASTTVAIGAAGTAGAAGANPGNAGGDTTFDSTVIVAKGGLGGLADTVAVIHSGGLGAVGGAAASGTGDFKTSGQAGGYGVALAAAQATSGQGGSSYAGAGGASVKTTAAGGAAGPYGGGGGGGCAISGGANQVGGVGGIGVIRVWEFA